KWQENKKTIYEQPLNIYEIHPGTWKKKEDGSFLNYRELAAELVPYVKEMGYTHIELMPINEHPFDRSWGYQSTGYYSVTSRYGQPDDFKYLVDYCHREGIGVILDWVPGHFCKDGHGLIQFDGTKLYEYNESWKAEKVEWGTLTFNFARNEVQSFLISNAVFWFDVYHLDGIRVDAVASMLYFNDGQINRDAENFLKKLNKTVFEYYPHKLMIAEESSTWPLVTTPVDDGGLGFNYKWNMGWMNDMLKYMEKDPVYRKHHHNLITFSLFYAFSENFILPLSHDEVVYGKKSLLNKMPGDYWQKFANLRVFLGYMATHPGKKLLFMGGEFGQFDEWKDLEQLDWFLLDYEMHAKCREYVRQLNNFYLKTPALWEKDHQSDGFVWIDADNSQQSIISFVRRGKKEDNFLLVICNFTPEYYREFKTGVPDDGNFYEVFNSDLKQYGGSHKKNEGICRAVKGNYHQQPYYINIEIPPLAILIFKYIKNKEEGDKWKKK
ncbi:MAG: 1,4-alpha-glucan branching protein GlgB, partial [Halanaerobiaceae bacterium]